MSLDVYRAKRNLRKSREPKAVQKKSSSLNFVVQKHAARHLHYDVRLEYKGVLLSWAVPKQPSLNPHDKRLAIKVEDHPLDYQYFEGVIPKGSYGAGTVEIWDRGSYEPHEWTDNRIVFTLHGNRVQGTYVLIRYPSKGERTWLLFKRAE